MKWENNLSEILLGNIIVNNNSSLRGWILKKKIFPYKCNKCKIKKWNSEMLVLELEHIDGNRKNNKKKNLELLCPNCHSQTHTYRGKNIKKTTHIIDDSDKIIDLFKKGYNISQILNTLNWSGGRNYKIIYKILKDKGINLPTKHDMFLLQKDKNQQKIEKKLNVLQNRINIVKTCNIDFNQRGWGLKLSKLINLTSSATLKFVKRELPEFSKKCWQHSNNLNI